LKDLYFQPTLIHSVIHHGDTSIKIFGFLGEGCFKKSCDANELTDSGKTKAELHQQFLNGGSSTTGTVL